MARMDPVPRHELDDELRHMCEESERQSGTSISTRTYAKNPAVLKALAAFRGALAREGTIDPVTRELVRLKIASLNGCRY
jgi:alkylhydroperoxidase family enzyme